MDNAKLLRLVLRLTDERKITADDARDFLNLIPADAESGEVSTTRQRIESYIDFYGITLRGRKGHAPIKGKAIITDKISQAQLEAVIKGYWRNRQKNNAEMGRVMAVLHTLGYINPTGKLTKCAEYFAALVGGEWNAGQIRRAYSEVEGMNEYSFNFYTEKERDRLAPIMQKETKRK